MTDYNFEEFKGKKLREQGSYIIILYTNCIFGFLSGFYLKEEIKNFKKVILFFDKTKKAIAFKFTNDEHAENAFTITHRKNGGVITAQSFFKKNNLINFLGKKIVKKEEDAQLGTIYIINLI